MAITSTQITSILKRYYTDKKFQNLLFRTSPVLKEIQTNRVIGREYAFGAMATRNPGIAGNAQTAVSLAATGQQNVEFFVPPGAVFSVFNLSQLDILSGGTGENNKGSYVQPIINSMFASVQGLRQVLAGAVLYGAGFGDFGVVDQSYTINNGSNTVNMSSSAVMALDIGAAFQVTTGTIPSGTLNPSVNTVTAISSVNPGTGTGTTPPTYTVTFTTTGSAGETWTAGEYFVLYGFANAGAALAPTGLAGWVPSFYNRGAAGGSDLTAWNTYIGTTFFNVNRSSIQDRLAGNFYLRNAATGEKRIDALIEGLRLSRRAGAMPNMAVVNDYDYKLIMIELQLQQQYNQVTNVTGSARAKNPMARGTEEISTIFSTSFLESLTDDPYCPFGTAYILDTEQIEFAAISAVDKVIKDSIPDNEPGKDTVDQAQDPGTQFNLIIDDMIDIQPGSMGIYGPTMQVTITFAGNFAIRNPSNQTVVKF